ncbi:hypothetical protein BGZ74_011443 [Mortierella antarctica]|nr:hypothetical protein BGZ74_011443 [Mortierella antarctica]
MTATASASSPAPTKNVFRLHGVNVLNRKNVDSISRLTALEKRRATHILDERQRRDTMNQLLAELANLVRESSAEASQQQQPSQPALNADGTEKKPPVKSNSITTLRNAITEIRRLRTCAGLETTTPPCPASLAVQSSSAPSSRSSSPSSAPSPAMASQSYVQPSSHKQQQYAAPSQQLPALAPSTSQYTTPVSSPKSYANQAPLHFHQNQLQSPPLSPSSPASHKYAVSTSSVSPPMVPTIHHSHNNIPSLPSLFAPNSPVAFSSYQPQPQYNGQYVLQQQQYYEQQQYESYSRHSSPVNGSAPSMSLPQSYMQYSPAPSSY